jgi:hypothetical protein
VGRQWHAYYGHHNLVPNNSDSGLRELWRPVRRYGRQGSRTSNEDDGRWGAVAGRCYARVRWNSWQQRQWAAYYIRLGNYAVVIEEPISHDMTFDYIRSNRGRRENKHNLMQMLNAINGWRYIKPNQTLFMDDRSTNQQFNIYSYVSNKYMLCTGAIFTHFAIPQWPTGQNDLAVDTGWLLLGKVYLHHAACRVHHIPGSPTHLANLGPLAGEDLHVAGIPSTTLDNRPLEKTWLRGERQPTSFVIRHKTTIDHITASCVFTRELWHLIVQALGKQAPHQQLTIKRWWRQLRALWTGQRQKKFDNLFILVSWQVWKEWNARWESPSSISELL